MTTNSTARRQRTSPRHALKFAILIATAIGSLTGCNKPSASTLNAAAATLTASDVIGLTEAELRAKYPEMADLDRSFDLLVSKNLHPYRVPPTNKLLQFGRAYVVAELKDGRVIALHHVSG